jgi:dipeptidyl aminopeptidase/acylaminoacyl peptidase
MTGNDVFERSPLQAVGKLNGRPFFIAHGELDERLSVQYAYDLAAEIRAHGQEVDPWIFKGSGHVIGMFDYPVEYENRLIDFFGKSLGLKVNL